MPAATVATVTGDDTTAGGRPARDDAAVAGGPRPGDDDPGAADPRRRRLFAAGAVVAAVVAVVFATVGDGVDVEADGLRGLLVDHAHTAVWVLLAAALGIAAVAGRWHRVAGWCATAALVLYVAFLAALFVGNP